MKTLQNTDEYIALEASGREYKANKCVGIELTGHTAQDDDVINSRRKETASTGAAMFTFPALPSARFYSRARRRYGNAEQTTRRGWRHIEERCQRPRQGDGHGDGHGAVAPSSFN